MWNMVKVGCVAVVMLNLGFLLALACLRYMPIAKVQEPSSLDIKYPELSVLQSNTFVTYTVADLPDGWTLLVNQGQYRIKDPTGTNRFPLMWFYGERREYRGNFTSIHKAVSDAIEHQQRDDLENDKKWKPVYTPKEPLAWMPEKLRYPDLSKIAFSSVFALEKCCDSMYSSGKSSNEVYTFYTNELRKMREQKTSKE